MKRATVAKIYEMPIDDERYYFGCSDDDNECLIGVELYEDFAAAKHNLDKIFDEDNNLVTRVIGKDWRKLFGGIHYRSFIFEDKKAVCIVLQNYDVEGRNKYERY